MIHFFNTKKGCIYFIGRFPQGIRFNKLLFIDNCLKLYGFGESICKWVSLFFSKREAFILLGGNLSEKIILEQGVPQGDVISPYIFLLSVEILPITLSAMGLRRRNPIALS